MAPGPVPQPVSHSDPKPPPPISSSSNLVISPIPDPKHKNPSSSSGRPSSQVTSSGPPPPPPPLTSSVHPPPPAIPPPPPQVPANPSDPFPPFFASTYPSSSAAPARPPLPTLAAIPSPLPSDLTPTPSFPSSSHAPVISPATAFPQHIPPPPRPKPAITPRSSAATPNQPSYAQVARGPRGPGFVRSHASNVEAFARLPRTGINIICGSREGIPSFSFVNSDLPKVEELYSKSLVMKFHGGRPSLEASHKEISSWGIDQPFSIGPLSSRAFLLRFQDETDLLKVLSRPSTTLITFPYRIFRWHSLCHMKEDSCIAPVWISLPKLPLQCFVPEFLEAVANKIGRFLCIDKATATLARPSAARLCVEIDLRKPPPQFIWVGLLDGFKQPILYEKMPKFCNGCQIQGHSSVDCSRAPLDNHQSQVNRRSVPQPASTQSVRHNAATTPNPNKSAPADHPNIGVSPATANSIPKPPTSDQPHPDDRSLSNTHHATFSHQEPDHTISQPASNPSSQPPNTLSTSPIENQPPLAQPLPTVTTSYHHTSSNQFAVLTPSDHITNHNPPASSHRLLHPNAPQKSSLSRSIRKSKQKRKSVAFAPHQSNLEANIEFWDSLNRQMATIDRGRTDAPRIDASTRPISPIVSDDPEPTSQSTVPQAAQGIEDSESTSSGASHSRPQSPEASSQDTQNPYDPSKSVSYDSEGEEPTAEPTSLQGHNTDDMLHPRSQSSKRNKRHPDQPLKVQLMVRKDPNPNL